MADFAYALHTDRCTYLLDETGVCLWVLSPDPKAAPIVEACVDAQFVACTDPKIPGGLVGELVEEASALFVTVSKETGRPILLRTGPIRRVQIRNPGDEAEPTNLTKPAIAVISDEDLIEPTTLRKPLVPRPVRKKEPPRPAPPLRPSKRKPEIEESSITLETYPGGVLHTASPAKLTKLDSVSEQLPGKPSDDAAPILLKNKKKKG